MTVQSIAKPKKFDIYSDMRVPFAVGAWARGHKFDLTAVKLTRALMVLESLQSQQDDLQKRVDKAQQQLTEAIADATAKMEKSDGA
jgi:hypothetical protein